MIAQERDADSDDGTVDIAVLYERHWGTLARVAYLLVGSWAQAEEIVQEAFAKLLATPRQMDNPGGYLRTMVVNAARSQLRHRGVVARAPQPRIVDAVDAVDAPDELSDLLATLSPRARAVLVMRYYLDVPEAEIAATLGCRPATVRSITSRTLARLRKELSDAR